MTTRSGYAIRIVGFVPTDLATKNPAGAEGSTTDALFRLMEVEAFDVKPVTRRAKDGGGTG